MRSIIAKLAIGFILGYWLGRLHEAKVWIMWAERRGVRWYR